MSAGTTTATLTWSVRPGGGSGAASSSARAIGPRSLGDPAALSTVMVTGSVRTARTPWRTVTAPITSAPARSARSSSDRLVVRTGPPLPPTETSVKSRDPTMVKPASEGRTMASGSGERDRVRTVSVTGSPTRTRVRSTPAVTSGGPCTSARSASAVITSS